MQRRTKLESRFSFGRIGVSGERIGWIFLRAVTRVNLRLDEATIGKRSSMFEPTIEILENQGREKKC